jgi:hypothetical protein
MMTEFRQRTLMSALWAKSGAVPSVETNACAMSMRDRDRFANDLRVHAKKLGFGIPE